MGAAYWGSTLDGALKKAERRLQVVPSSPRRVHVGACHKPQVVADQVGALAWPRRSISASSSCGSMKPTTFSVMLVLEVEDIGRASPS